MYDFQNNFYFVEEPTKNLFKNKIEVETQPTNNTYLIINDDIALNVDFLDFSDANIEFNGNYQRIVALNYLF